MSTKCVANVDRLLLSLAKVGRGNQVTVVTWVRLPLRVGLRGLQDFGGVP